MRYPTSLLAKLPILPGESDDCVCQGPDLRSDCRGHEATVAADGPTSASISCHGQPTQTNCHGQDSTNPDLFEL